MRFLRGIFLFILFAVFYSCNSSNKAEVFPSEKDGFTAIFNSEKPTDPTAKPRIEEKGLSLFVDDYARWIDSQEGITFAKVANDSNEIVARLKPAIFTAAESALSDGTLTKQTLAAQLVNKKGYDYYWLQLSHKVQSAQNLKYGSQKEKMKASIFFVYNETDTIREFIIEEFKNDIGGKPIDYMILMPTPASGKDVRMVINGAAFGLSPVSLYLHNEDRKALPTIKI